MTSPAYAQFQTPDQSVSPPVWAKEFETCLKQAGLKGEFLFSHAERLVAATDNSVYQVLPQAVCYPKDSDDIATLVQQMLGFEEEHLTLSPRGGGTGTNGQSLTNGIILDVSRHMNAILAFDEETPCVTVQPGVVLDQLNHFLKKHGYFFPPTVSTSSRATLGGMVGTDASGKGSRIYGKTSDYIEAMELVLSDGTKAKITKDHSPQTGLLGVACQQVRSCLSAHEDLIAKTFPKMNRGLTGYNLRQAAGEGGILNLGYLLAGSEGSLGITSELTLRVLPLPKERAIMAVLHPSLEDALDCVEAFVVHDPAAVELIDDRVIALARGKDFWLNLEQVLGQDDGGAIGGLSIIEFVSDSPDAIKAKMNGLRQAIADDPDLRNRISAHRDLYQADEISAIWAMRKQAVGLLGGLQGKRGAMPFVEDTAVPPASLPDFIRDFRAILDKYELNYGMFGHADVGCLHVRPTLDMTEDVDQVLFRQISDEVAELAHSYGGLLWGEHGKGYRGEYSKDAFGPVLYEELRKIKRSFDPENRFNPGKIALPDEINAKPVAIDAVPFRGDFDRQIDAPLRDEMGLAIRCNGNGACFNWNPNDAMCPSYKASGDRRQSPKGRAAQLREWARLKGKAQFRQERQDLASLEEEVFASLGSCLSCKACKGQCPVSVDIPQMKAHFLDHYYQTRNRPLRDQLIRYFESLLPLMSRFSASINIVQQLSPIKSLMAKLGLVDLPALSQSADVRDLEKNWSLFDPTEVLADRTILILQDGFTRHYDAKLLSSHCRLLEKLGYQIRLLPYLELGKPVHVLGNMQGFERIARRVQEALRPAIASGLPILVLEPSVAVSLQQDYASVKQVGSIPVQLFAIWLAKEIRIGNLPELSCSHTCDSLNLFLHCTEKTAYPAVAKDWQQIFDAFGIKVSMPATGCCGMAGLFGHQSEHQEMSKQLFDISWKEALIESDGESVATGFSCRCQSKRFNQHKLRHPVEILLDRLNKH